jgi:hypothetical protein
MAGAPWMVKGG